MRGRRRCRGAGGEGEEEVVSPGAALPVPLLPGEDGGVGGHDVPAGSLPPTSGYFSSATKCWRFCFWVHEHYCPPAGPAQLVAADIAVEVTVRTHRSDVDTGGGGAGAGRCGVGRGGGGRCGGGEGWVMVGGT